MDNQLHLTDVTLIDIGFKQVITERKDYNDKIRHDVIFETLPHINTTIYYNPLLKDSVWYMKTTIGESHNYICLDIRTIDDLYAMMNLIKMKYTYVSR